MLILTWTKAQKWNKFLERVAVRPVKAVVSDSITGALTWRCDYGWTLDEVIFSPRM